MALQDLTVMICTFQRPEMLREALQSVRKQTALDTVARIIVSENSSSVESKTVCAEFPDLPILYVQQRPPVSALEHPREIWHLVETPLLAVLHDDDWWGPAHLAEAVDVFRAHPSCAAVFSSFLESFGAHGYAWLSQVYYFAWLASGCNFGDPVIFLDQPDVMLGCIVNAGFHYSTVVGRTEVMRDAWAKNIETRNTFDNDRTFPVFLSQHGPIAYITTPSVYVRQHPFRDAWCSEHLLKGHMNMASATTRWLLDHYPHEVSLACAKFKGLASKLDSASADQIWRVLRHSTAEPQWSTLIRDCGLELTAMKRPLEHSFLPMWANDLINAVCPPILYQWAMKSVWERLMLFKQKKIVL